jgi:hypothetical protein
VRFHDLHHIVTGYPTTTLGESEIGAWELGSRKEGGTCTAWALDAVGVFVGLFLDRRAIARAMRAGRQCRNLFSRDDYNRLLELSVEDLRREVGWSEDVEFTPRLSDWIRVALYGAAGAPLALAIIGGTVLLQPVAMFAARDEQAAKRERLAARSASECTGPQNRPALFAGSAPALTITPLQASSHRTNQLGSLSYSHAAW